MSFKTSGAYGILWKDENVLFLDLRSKTAVECDERGEIVNEYTINNTGNSICCSNEYRKKEMISENENDEFIELELTYLVSAKVKDSSTLIKGEQECAVYKDVAKDYVYTYSYRLFSSKEEYDGLKKRMWVL